jgi:hypothetical protein
VPTGKKLDLKKEMKQLYAASAKDVAEVIVPPMSYVMIDGQGDPNTSADYHAAVEALFSVSYTLKFAMKKSGGADYSVMPLESLWWTEGNKPFEWGEKSDWHWTAMIAQPSFVTREEFKSALDALKKKKDLAALPRMRFEPYKEGKSLQILHVGPYSAEGPTVARLRDRAKQNDYSFSGKHHEIYLSTPDRTAPEKLKTIIRQPVK